MTTLSEDVQLGGPQEVDCPAHVMQSEAEKLQSGDDQHK
jgi:hypothetical protein